MIRLALLILIAQQGVAWTASADHNTTRPEDGQPKLTGYRIITADGTNRIRITDVGKPVPNAGNEIAVSTTAPFTGFAAGTYSVFVTAYGPDGESAESNRDSFTIAAPPPPQPTCAGSVTDAQGGVWTFGPACETLRNGVWMGEPWGKGTQYLLVDGFVYVLGTDGAWYKWIGLWEFYGPTAPTPAPPPPPPPTGDTTAPVISGMLVSQHGKSANNTVTVDASDNIEVIAVDVFLDGVLKGSDPIAPFTVDMKISGGAHVVSATARDAAGNTSSIQRSIVR